MREPEDLPTFDLTFHAERSPVPAFGSSHTQSCTTLLPRCLTRSLPMLNQMVADLQHSSAVRFSSSGFVRPVRIRGEFHVGALMMLPWVAENAPRTTFNISAQSLQPFPVVLSWSLHPRGELTSCCTEVRAVLRHVDCERGAAAIQSCGALRQNLHLSLRLLPVVILEVLCSHGREHGRSSFGLLVPEFSQSSTHVLCPELGSITRSRYRDRTRRAVRRGFSEAGSSLGISMKSGLSLNPHKKAAVTSKSITLNLFPDDLRVAALEIKLLAIDSPGVPENRVSRSMASLANSRATRRAFGLGHSTVPLFVMTHLAGSITDSGSSCASLRSTTSYTPLSANFCSSTFFASVIWSFVSSGGTCLHTLYDHHGVQQTPHSLCASVKWESAEFCFPEDDRHITALIKPSISDLSFDVCSGRPRSQ